MVQPGAVAGRVDKVKTESSGTLIPLDSALAKILLNWKSCSEFNGDNDWVWASPFQAGEKRYLSWSVQQRHIKPAGIKSGLGPIGWDTLRLSYRSWLDATGAPLGVPQTTDRAFAR